MPLLETFANASVRGFRSGINVEPQTYELISSAILGSATSTITFSAIPQTYKHLQIRTSARSAGFVGQGQIRFNGDATNSYSFHQVAASNSSTFASADTTYPFMGINNWVWQSTNSFNTSIIDILDYSVGTKNKTMRVISGRNSFADGNQTVSLSSGQWMKTDAISSITILLESSGSYATGSRFSLYGIVG